MNKTIKYIYNELNAGTEYGEIDETLNKAVGALIYWNVLYITDNNLIGLRHNGTTAYKNTLKELEYIITEVLKLTPAEFLQKYITRKQAERIIGVVDEYSKISREWYAAHFD